MAVTSIWPIKGRVDKVINYARNPEKTHDKKSLLKLHEIEGVIEYAADEMKTETRALVTCLNLSSEENAAKEFMEVKHRYGKEDGRVCYHGYQSLRLMRWMRIPRTISVWLLPRSFGETGSRL